MSDLRDNPYVARFFQLGQEVDLNRLLGLQVLLVLFGSLASNPNYNLPIFLFGIWAYHYHESNEPLKKFLLMIVFSILLDIVWFSLHGYNFYDERGHTFALICNIIDLILKPITAVSTLQNLTIRGDPSGLSGDYWNAGGNSASNTAPYQTMFDRDDEDTA